MEDKKTAWIVNNANIIGDRTYLRKLTIDDITERYINWINDPEINRYLSIDRNQDYESLANYIRSFNSSCNKLLLGIIVKENNLHIGNVTFCPIDWNNDYAALGISIGDKQFQGKGYAKGALSLAIKYGFKKLNFNRLEAGIHANNLPSLRLFESLGFKKEALFRQRDKRGNQYEDGIYMGLLKSEYELNKEKYKC